MSVSTEADPDNWIPVSRGKLTDVRGHRCEDQVGKKTFEFDARQARFARFEVISYYGRGAVLEFFDMN